MQRVPQLDGLRGVAILMVFATHALRVPGLWMGVDLFFVLSGYLITGILLRLKESSEITGYWRPFYQRRALRILPAYLGFMIFIVLVFAPRWTSVWYWYMCFGSNFPLAMGRVPSDIVAPLWSLAVEEQFYLIWPWIVLWCRETTLRRVALGIVVVAPVLRAAATPLFSSHLPIYSLTPFRADTLACGALIAICERQNAEWFKSSRRPALWGVIGTGLMLLVLARIPSFRTGANTVLFNALGYSLSVAMFGCTLIYALDAPGFLRSLMIFRPLRYLGRVSYTFYLYHVAVLWLVAGHLHAPLLLALLGFALTTAVASLSWHALESPILKRNRNYKAAKSSILSEPLVESSLS